LRAHDPSALEISQGNGPAAPGDPGAGSLTLQRALELAARLAGHAPGRTESIGAIKLRVPIGVVVIQAAGAGSSRDQVYLLRDRPVLSGDDIVKPRQGNDPITGVPNVAFGFTARGARTFEAFTAMLAHRGARVSGLGQTLNQHFAVAHDNKLIDVPFVDFKQYPDGITVTDGVELSGDFTRRWARTLAILLRYGPLPVNLTAAG
jgi:preprotein translocase subunit SecD